MPPPTLALATPEAFMKAALNEQHGYKTIFDTRKQALSFRARCYAARRRLRDKNDKIYVDEPSYQRYCVYDALVFDIKPTEEGWQFTAFKTDFFLEHTNHGPLTAEEAAEIKGGVRLLADDPAQALNKALGRDPDTKAPDMETPSVDVDEELPPDPFGASDTTDRE